MPSPTEPSPSRNRLETVEACATDRGTSAAPMGLPGAAGWTTCLLVLFAVAAGNGCPMDMDPPDNNNGNGSMCDSGAAIGTPTVSFANDLAPLFENNGCLSAGCHGGAFPSSGYSLTDYESAFEPGDEATSLDACPIVPGDPDNSYLIEKLSPNPRSGARMPFLRAPLTDEQIQLIRTWIDEGAPNN